MSKPEVGRNLLVVASLVVVATLAAAVWVMDSPSENRDLRLDLRRVENLDAIVDAVNAWSATRKSLPTSLVELADQPGLALAVVDPATGVPYEYEATSKYGYRLCAVFATSTAGRRTGAHRPGWIEKGWLHPAGRHCFDRTAGEADADRKAAAAATR